MRRSSWQLPILFALAVLALAITPKTTAAQGGTIRGRIADSTGAPVAQAVIVLDPGGLRATSRETGDYVITHIPSGVYTVRVRRLGYLVPTATVTIADGQMSRQDFTVNHAAVSLTDVVIGSRARHTAAEELAVSGRCVHTGTDSLAGNYRDIPDPFAAVAIGQLPTTKRV